MLRQKQEARHLVHHGMCLQMIGVWRLHILAVLRCP
jgi:hypothetical protein